MEPSRVLYTDDTSQSKEAESLLCEAGLNFQSIFISDPIREEKNPPQLLTFEGFFPTLDDIRWYARGYGKKEDE